MQVKRTPPHRSAPAGRGRAGKGGAKGADGATDNGGGEAAPGKRARASRARATPPSATSSAGEAMAPPKPRRTRSSKLPAEAPMAAEVALSIVEMGDALASLASHAGAGERARSTRLAAQAFVDDVSVVPSETTR